MARTVAAAVARIGVMSGATSMAPITTPAESANKPKAAMDDDSTISAENRMVYTIRSKPCREQLVDRGHGFVVRFGKRRLLHPTQQAAQRRQLGGMRVTRIVFHRQHHLFRSCGCRATTPRT